MLTSFHRHRVALAAALCGPLAVAHPAAANALSAKDVQIVCRALGFLDPAPSGAVTIGIVFAPDQPTSKAEADAMFAAFGDGVKGGSLTCKAKLMAITALSGTSDVAALIATSGTTGDAVMAAAKAHHIPCVAADDAQVKAGRCVMSVRSEPKVEISVSHAAADAAGISFASAFRMMIHEL